MHSKLTQIRFGLLCGICIVGWSARYACAQTFNSGSNGSDGALNLTQPGTIVFDPKSFNPPLDPDGDNVYHFTTINIASGVTVKLSGSVINGPVFWLASGNVQIDGTVSLDGDVGTNCSSIENRRFTTPGSGGYSGGLCNVAGASNQSGGGPGAGIVGTNAINATFAGTNQFLVPLLGGSGGAGFNGNGGAGGGAILIASSVAIAVTGKISANGGAGSSGGSGSGSGGAIRLVAPIISGSGTLSAIGAVGAGGVGSGNGEVRLEGFQISNSLVNAAYSYGSAVLYRATPFGVFLPPATPASSIRITSVNGVAVPPSPTASFTVPDVIVNSATAVPITIEGVNVPSGTVAKLYVSTQNFPDQTINATLTGSSPTATATVSVTLPSGYSVATVRASWTQ